MENSALFNIHTINEFENLPEGIRAELIDGNIYYMASPSYTHQRIVTELSRVIGNYISDNKGDYKVIIAPFAVYLTKDNKTYVEPDLLVNCDNCKIQDEKLIGAPDWVVEVTVDSTRGKDFIIKMPKYKNAGVKEYWIIDNYKDKNLVHVYSFIKEEIHIYSFNDDIPVGIYKDFTIKINDLDIPINNKQADQ